MPKTELSPAQAKQLLQNPPAGLWPGAVRGHSRIPAGAFGGPWEKHKVLARGGHLVKLREFPRRSAALVWWGLALVIAGFPAEGQFS